MWHWLAINFLLVSLFTMKKPIAWMVAAMASIFLISAASADETKAPVAKAAAESKVPTLTYYYFDG